MSIKRICTCDRCKESFDITERADYTPTQLYLPAGSARTPVRASADLCDNCRRELVNLTTSHFFRWDDDEGAYVAMEAPYAEIAALETYLEDAHKDVEVLEEELERLRDVKDKLFEANFVLTARLRELGVEVDDREGAHE